MFYTFPQLTDISQVRNAFAVHERSLPAGEKLEFIEKVIGDLSVFNYNVNFAWTFRSLDGDLSEEELMARKILRECRGLVFNNKTGKIVRRPYHKFFNIGERDETMPNVVDIGFDHVILEKLDGSMISPVIKNGKRYFATKMIDSDVADNADAFAHNAKGYNELADWCDKFGFSCIFEWCSRRNRIVIDYAVDMMILTAVRHMEYGYYISYEDLVNLANKFNVPVVKALPGSIANMNEFMGQVADIKGQEGYVIRFANGMMGKVKAEEYKMFHGAKDGLSYEKDVLRMVLKEAVDDAVRWLNKTEADVLVKYHDDVLKNIRHKADELYWVVLAEYDNLNGSKKKFAELVKAHKVQNEHGIMFKIWDYIDQENCSVDKVYDHMKSILLVGCNTGNKVNQFRNLFGNVSWYDYYVNRVDLDG